MGKPSRRRVRAPGIIRAYLQATHAPVVGFAVTLPLLLLYNVGLLMPGARVGNGADLLSGLVSRQWGLWGMLGLNAVLVVASVVALAWLARKGRFSAGRWITLVLEGVAYGVALGLLVPWVLGQAFPMSVAADAAPSVPARPPFLEILAISAGAGYWEELVFRLGFVGGPLAIARRAFAGPRPGARLGVAAVALAAVVLSSLAFSLAHHLGAIEPPAAYVFWYRALAGIVFGGVFLARGFAVAAYAHFLYDVLVMLL
jgi:hypothetical protein